MQSILQRPCVLQATLYSEEISPKLWFTELEVRGAEQGAYAVALF